MANTLTILMGSIAGSLLFSDFIFAQTAVSDYGGPLRFEKSEEMSLDEEIIEFLPAVNKNSPRGVFIPVRATYKLKNHFKDYTKVEIAFVLPSIALSNTKGSVGGNSPNDDYYPDNRLWIEKIEQVSKKGWEDRFQFKGQQVLHGLSLRQIPFADSPCFGERPGELEICDLQDQKLLAHLQQELDAKSTSDLLKLFDQVQVQRTHRWNYTFAPNSSLKIVHEFDLGAGFLGIGSWKLNLIKKRTGPVTAPTDVNTEARGICFDKIGPAFLKKQPDSTGIRWINYDLIGANKWQNPTKKFKLIVHTPLPKSLFSSCFKDLKKTNTNLFEATMKDFIPSENFLFGFTQQLNN